MNTINTRDQSKDVNNWGADNYLNNRIHSWGWTFNNRIMGSPLFTFDQNKGK